MSFEQPRFQREEKPSWGFLSTQRRRGTAQQRTAADAAIAAHYERDVVGVRWLVLEVR
jgi:hypothetical protein